MFFFVFFFFVPCLCMRACALLTGSEKDGVCRPGRRLAAIPWPATARAVCLAKGGVARLPFSNRDCDFAFLNIKPPNLAVLLLLLLLPLLLVIVGYMMDV